MFDYSVRVKYRYRMKVTASKTPMQVATGIAKDIMKKFSIFAKVKKMGVVMTFFSFALMVFS